jgi:hypothetical protein
LSSHLHPKHNLPIRTKVMTFSRQHYNQNSVTDSKINIATKQQQFQQEIATKVLEFQQRAKQIQENLKTVKLRAMAARKINHLNQDRTNEKGRR